MCNLVKKFMRVKTVTVKTYTGKYRDYKEMCEYYHSICPKLIGVHYFGHCEFNIVQYTLEIGV